MPPVVLDSDIAYVKISVLALLGVLTIVIVLLATRVMLKPATGDSGDFLPRLLALALLFLGVGSALGFLNRNADSGLLIASSIALGALFIGLRDRS